MTLKAPDNRVITVPNSLVYSGTITNYHAEPMRRERIEALQCVVEQLPARFVHGEIHVEEPIGLGIAERRTERVAHALATLLLVADLAAQVAIEAAPVRGRPLGRELRVRHAEGSARIQRPRSGLEGRVVVDERLVDIEQDQHEWFTPRTRFRRRRG